MKVVKRPNSINKNYVSTIFNIIKKLINIGFQQLLLIITSHSINKNSLLTYRI